MKTRKSIGMLVAALIMGSTAVPTLANDGTINSAKMQGTEIQALDNSSSTIDTKLISIVNSEGKELSEKEMQELIEKGQIVLSNSDILLTISNKEYSGLSDEEIQKSQKKGIARKDTTYGVEVSLVEK